MHDENLALLDEIRGERRDAVKQRTDLAAMLTDEQQRASLQRTELAAMISDEQARANAQRTDLAKMLADEQHRAQTQRDHIRQQVEQTDAKLDHVIAMINSLGSQTNPIVVHSQSRSAQSASTTTSNSPPLFEPPRHSTGRSSLARAANPTTVEEEEKRTGVNTARGKSDVYDWMPSSTAAVCDELPTFNWPKKSVHHAKLTGAFIELTHEYTRAKIDPRTYANEIPSRLRTLGKTLGDADAALLQSLSALAREGVTSPTLVCSLAEIGLLTTTAFETVRALRMCGTEGVAASEAEFDGWIAGKTMACGGPLLEGCFFKAYHPK